VMNSVITNPLNDVILNANCLKNHEKHLEWVVCLEASVCPVAMCTWID
jgi:hypothetical protein